MKENIEKKISEEIENAVGMVINERESSQQSDTLEINENKSA